MIQLLLIRHGATKGNLEKRYIGKTDEPLCGIGIGQVERLKKQLPSVDRVFVSPMLRTKQTAAILFPSISHEVVVDFRETDFGIFEGKTVNELSDSFEYRKWVSSICRDPVPGGESISKFKERCCAAFRVMIENVSDDFTVALVVHGGVIMAIMEAFARPKRDFYDYRVENGSYVRCTYDSGVILLSATAESDA